MKEITFDVAAQILSGALSNQQRKRIAESVTILDEIRQVAMLIQRDEQETLEQFKTWSGSTTMSASESASAALRFASKMGRAPWDKNDESPPTLWNGLRVVDWNDEVWTPKRRIEPVKGYKKMRLRRCATCNHLVNIAHFGAPECDRPDGPKFDNDILDAFTHSCQLWRENKDKTAAQRLLKSG